MTKITSRDNSLLRQARAVRDGKLDGLIFVEGLRLCEEGLRSGLSIEAVIHSDELARKEHAASVINALRKASDRIASVSEKLLESVSYTKTPQGVVLLAKRPSSGPEQLASAFGRDSLIVVMHKINNPVNVGAILRTAEAAGASGAIATETTSDPLSPKALRGAMGSAFRLPIWTGPTYQQVVDWCEQRKVVTICADAEAGESYTEVDWTSASALILGPESSGLTHEEIEAARHSVRIPMNGMVESLNVSVAAGVLLYEAARQRQLKNSENQRYR
jgi:RNA methyltransferase, TrmH family